MDERRFRRAVMLALMLAPACGGLRVLPQSPVMSEAKLARDELNVAVRVTKKGFCLGVVAVFHGEEPQPEPSCQPLKRQGVTDGGLDLESLTQFLTEAQSQHGRRLRVTVGAERDVPRDEVRRVVEALRTARSNDRAKPGAPRTPPLDLAITEGVDGL